MFCEPNGLNNSVVGVSYETIRPRPSTYIYIYIYIYTTDSVWSQVFASSAQTIPDCIRYIVGVLCYNFKSQTNILASY